MSNTKKEFLVANREIGTFSGALSVAATWIWAPALFVSATKAYTSGIPGLFWFTVPPRLRANDIVVYTNFTRCF